MTSTGPHLTGRQQDVLDYLVEYELASGESPTLQEIADHLGVHSLGTVGGYLAALEESGMLHRLATRRRGIRLTAEGRKAARPQRQARVVDAEMTARFTQALRRASPAERLTIVDAAKLLGVDLPTSGGAA